MKYRKINPSNNLQRNYYLLILKIKLHEKCPFLIFYPTKNNFIAKRRTSLSHTKKQTNVLLIHIFILLEHSEIRAFILTKVICTVNVLP